jgi:hypothetical protein
VTRDDIQLWLDRYLAPRESDDPSGDVPPRCPGGVQAVNGALTRLGILNHDATHDPGR